MATIPTHFRFWILRHGSGHVLDFRFINSTLKIQNSKLSFYDLVRPCQHIRWNRETDLLRGLQIDHQLELRRLLHWQVSRLGAFEDLVDISGGAPPQVGQGCSVGYKAASLHPKTLRMHRWEPVLGGEIQKPFSVTKHKGVRYYTERARLPLGCGLECALEIVGAPH